MSKMKAYSKYGEDRLSFDVVDPGRKVSGAIYFDVKELANKEKGLERPAKALEAYLNAGFYDKDVDKMKDLTGEDEENPDD